MFVVMNIALGLGNYNKYTLSYQLDANQVAIITDLLNEKDIHIEGKLPLSYNAMESITLKPQIINPKLKDEMIKSVLYEDLAKVMITKEKKTSEYEQEQLIYKYGDKELKFQGNEIHYMDTNIVKKEVVAEKKQILSTADRFIKQLPIEENDKNKIINYKIESYGAEVTYYEVYKGFPLFDSYVRMQVTPDGVCDAEIKMTEKGKKTAGKQSITPVNHVLFELSAHIEQTEHTTISSIELGYGLKEKERTHLLEEEVIPMYKIRISGLDDPLFVNAYTNEVIE